MDKVTETELAAKATRPRVTPEDIERNIVSEHYFSAYEGVLGAAQAETLIAREVAVYSDRIDESLKLLTICIMVLRNGFTIQGFSACADPANYDRDIGNRLARTDAFNKIWALMGYELKTKISLMEDSPSPSLPDQATYVGTKVVHATPMCLGEYNEFRGWGIPEDEDADAEGYLIEYADGGKPNTDEFKGYVSWTPKEVFDKSYSAVGSKVPQPDWHDRLLIEKDQLEVSIKKLGIFVDANNPRYTALAEQEQQDLQLQLITMNEYKTLLTRRITRNKPTA